MIDACPILAVTLFGIMLSSLYLIDKALGRGLAIGLLNLLTRCKCVTRKYWLPLKNVPDIITNSSTSVSVLLSQFVVFSVVMTLLSRSRTNMENKLNDQILYSKSKLEETHRIVDSMIKRKKSEENAGIVRGIYGGKFLLDMDVPDDFFDDITSLSERPSKDAASGDCGEADAVTSASRHLLAVDDDDVVRIQDTVNQMFRDRSLHDGYMDHQVDYEYLFY